MENPPLHASMIVKPLNVLIVPMVDTLQSLCMSPYLVQRDLGILLQLLIFIVVKCSVTLCK